MTGSWPSSVTATPRRSSIAFTSASRSETVPERSDADIDRTAARTTSPSVTPVRVARSSAMAGSSSGGRAPAAVLEGASSSEATATSESGATGCDHRTGDALGNAPDRVRGGVGDQCTTGDLLARRALVRDDLGRCVGPVLPAPSGPDLDEVAPRAIDDDRLLGMSVDPGDELVLPGSKRQPGERAGGEPSDSHLVHGHLDGHGDAHDGVWTVDEHGRGATRRRRELRALVEIDARHGHRGAGTQSHEQDEPIHVIRHSTQPAAPSAERQSPAHLAATGAPDGCGGPQGWVQQSSRPVFTGKLPRHRVAGA